MTKEEERQKRENTGYAVGWFVVIVLFFVAVGLSNILYAMPLFAWLIGHALVYVFEMNTSTMMLFLSNGEFVLYPLYGIAYVIQGLASIVED